MQIVLPDCLPGMCFYDTKVSLVSGLVPDRHAIKALPAQLQTTEQFAYYSADDDGGADT